MNGPWENVTVKNHANDKLRHVQVNAKGTVRWGTNTSSREAGGYVYLQQIPGSFFFRLLLEGVELDENGTKVKIIEVIPMPTNVSWRIRKQAIQSENAGKAYAYRIDFGKGSNSQGFLQITMPLSAGNCRKSMLFEDALTYAKPEYV
jgi:hypothetical protein